ncbi:peptidoglycan DD-metalloendopeptidase family protein [Micromonospora sp. NPDC048871]|uniref:peptidoglycan DD-metalloendopeptidase family protein n=1 Tax=Micromonospora sp. NPDC048871 TaxID=3364259 RepID=UPI0037168141
MSIRLLTGIAVAVAGVLLLCSGLAPTLMLADRAAACGPTTGAAPTTSPTARSTAPTSVGPIGDWNAEQVGNAATITAVGIRLGVPPRGWVIAVATAMQESSLLNTPGGDRDSVGLFQQRPSQGWGTREQLLDPQYAATAFYRSLRSVDGWQAMPLTEAAQQVQRSAYPDAYARWEPDATRIVAALTRVRADLTACQLTVSIHGWTQPVHADVGSGFRTTSRPGHDGVDLIVAKGTPIHAASAGTVTVVRCNAVDVRTGRDWGCDRDGHPELTRGCGWYVDITHPDGVATRYCHLLTRPSVIEGQRVTAGHVIGVVGSSGHSSGPHLHFEVHLADHTSRTAVDPVGFMASVGAPLNQ